MAKKTKEAEDERELREVFRVFDKNSRGVIDVRTPTIENLFDANIGFAFHR